VIGLVILVFLVPVIHVRLIYNTLGWSLTIRSILTLLLFAPVATLMGIPFPLGIMVLENADSDMVPWVWAVNGSTSVVASVLAAILALTYGFFTVQFLGGMMYAGAALVLIFGFRLPKI
jgi:hypothetical protein